MNKASYLLILVIFSISTAYSVNTAAIESIRSRTVSSGAELSASDVAEIADFWARALDQMLLSVSSQEIVEIRQQLEQGKGNEHLSYYATGYIAQAKKSIQAAFKHAQGIENPQQRAIVQRNLMILTGNLKSPALASLAIGHLNSEDSVIRYWAVKSLTQPTVVQQLTDPVTRDEGAMEAILTALKNLADGGTQPQLLKMITRFCMSFDHPTARQILLTMATERIKAYQQWNVGNVQSDLQLLTALGTTAHASQNAKIKQDFGRAFAELYAMAIQRYWMGVQTLPDDDIDQLHTVIAGVDQNVLEKTMGIRTGILQALRTRNIPVLKREYETIFGDRMRSGKLAELLKFDYGKDASMPASESEQN